MGVQMINSPTVIFPATPEVTPEPESTPISRPALGRQGGGTLAAYRPAARSGAPALLVGKVQVRARVAFRELAPGWPVSGGGAASRRDARVILFLT